MKKSDFKSAWSCLLIIFVLPAVSFISPGQDASKGSAPLPDNISKIVHVTCMPCHSSTGGTLSKARLNFTEWANYSADKQKKKAKLIYKELKKDAMPPKSAREVNPGIVPTEEQKNTIKAWVDSF